jgi:carbon starvation protein CstA
VVLWAITVYLAQDRKLFWITLFPAVFMTAVTSTYLLFAPEGFSLPAVISYTIGIVIALSALTLFLVFLNRIRKYT